MRANAIALRRYKACASSRYADVAELNVVDRYAVCDYNEQNSLDISGTRQKLVY